MVLLIFLLCVISHSCTSNAHGNYVNKSSPEVEGSNDSGNIKHLVFLSVKMNVNLDSLKRELNKLSMINSVNNFQVGIFKDLNDPKSLSDFELVLEMNFNTEQDYHNYQSDSLHLILIEKTRHLMDGPPKSFDYMIEKQFTD